MADNSPSGILKDIEDFTRLLYNKGSDEVLTQHLKQFSPDDIELRYMFVCQMMALSMTRGERMQMQIDMIKMLAKHDGVDL